MTLPASNIVLCCVAARMLSTSCRIIIKVTLIQDTFDTQFCRSF
jgi:hypothetical protein